MTNTETLSTTALDVQAIRKKLGKHFSGLPVAELDTNEGRRCLSSADCCATHTASVFAETPSTFSTKPIRSRTPLSGSTTSQMTSNLRNEP